MVRRERIIQHDAWINIYGITPPLWQQTSLKKHLKSFVNNLKVSGCDVNVPGDNDWALCIKYEVMEKLFIRIKKLYEHAKMYMINFINFLILTLIWQWTNWDKIS